MLPHRAPAPGHKALRRHRFSVSGQVYLITTVTHGRRRVFADWETGCIAARKVADATLWRDSRVLCWVLMPDHLHAVVELGPSESLSRLMKRVKSVIASTLRGEAALRPRIWAAAFHDRALRHEDDLEDVARYVVLNPVRAGLVRRVWDYPFWDAIWVRGMGERGGAGRDFHRSYPNAASHSSSEPSLTPSNRNVDR
jgi:putative transposase